MIMNINHHFEALENYNVILYDNYLKEYIPADPSDDPDTYKLDVSAFCLLFHAAIEEYFEELAKQVFEEAIRKLKDHNIKTDAIVAICNNICKCINTPEDGKYDKTIKELIIEKIHEAKTYFYNELEKNNGTSKIYLTNILAKIGIDIQCDSNIENSLSKIVEYRGEYAHKRAKKIMAPEDAKNYADDCILYCLELSSRATECLK